MRRTLPFIMTTRAESTVYFEQQLDLTNTLRYIEERKAAGRPCSLFQIILCAAVRVLAQRPLLNQFVMGRRLYRRKAIELSFAVKKALSDEGGMTMVKATFQPGDTLDDVARRVDEAIGVGRGSQSTSSEKEMSFMSRLPRFLFRFLVALQRLADYFNLLPAGMIRPDPLYTSAVLANLGSVGIDSAYHHLYEHGTASLFAVIGRVRKAQVVSESGEVRIRDVVSVKHTFDERIADGFYCARALEQFKEWIEDPGVLEQPPTEEAT
jgi:hypothetical protein